MLFPQSRPSQKRVQRWTKSFAKRGQSVLYLGWNLRMYGALNNAVPFETSQLLDQHLLRHGWNGLLQLRESHDRRDGPLPSEEMVENGQFPVPFKKLERLCGSLRRAVRSVDDRG